MSMANNGKSIAADGQGQRLTPECALIGACLITPSLWDKVLSALTPEDFGAQELTQIAAAAQTLADAHREPDAPTIAEQGNDRALLMELMEVACVPSAVGQHIDLVRRHKRQREIAELGIQLTLDGADPDVQIAEAQDKLRVLAEDSTAEGMLAAQEIAERFAQYRAHIGERIVETGLTPLNHILGGGMLPGCMYVLAARPGCGKTALALQITDHVTRHGGSVLYASIEMGAEELQARRISLHSKIPSGHILLGDLSVDEEVLVEEVNQSLIRLPLYIVDSGTMTVAGIRTLAGRVPGLALIVIDHIGLLLPDKRYPSRYEEVTAVSRTIKTLAKATQVPVLALAQLNRASELRQDKKPMLADLRDSGAIEQDADAVLLLHRPDLYTEEEKGNIVYVHLSVAKNRHAGLGSFELGMVLQCGKFVAVQQMGGVASA